MDQNKELQQLKEENARLKKLLQLEESLGEDSYCIEDLIDIKKLEDIFVKFSKLTGFTTGFVKQDTREVLASSGWKDICINFHRSDSSAHICKASNSKLTKDLQAFQQISIQKCQHGMVDGATPLFIDGKHLADIFSGQVLFEEPQIEAFKKNAKEFGYDEKSYLQSLKDVKVISETQLKDVLDFLSSVAGLVAELGKEKKEFLKLNALLEKKVEERVSETQTLLTLFDKGENVLFKWNKDAIWSVDFVSQSVSSLLEYTKEDFEKNKISYIDCIHKEDLPRVVREVEEFINSQSSFLKHAPYRVITKSGQCRWILDNTVIVKEKEKITHFLGYLSDITELKIYESQLKELSITDKLTQTKNRLYIDEALHKQHYRFARDDEKCSVILIDIDFFKEVNDNYGHLSGDIFLKEFAQILKSNVRDSDTVGRWGGEEFLIILPHTDADSAFSMALKLQKIIHNTNFSNIGKRSASFGISELQKNMSVEQWIDKADRALYKSKESGRDRVSL